MSRKKLVLTAIIIALVIAIGGILAYFTDTDEKTNKFKMGKVDILVEEPSWTGGDEGVPTIPGKETPKDPQVKNQGEGNVYAFVKVTVPVRNVKVEEAAAAPTQLFTFRKKTSAANVTPVTYADGINSGWTLISTTPAVADWTAETQNVTYVYAWGTASALTPIAKNETTAPIFDAVKLVDIIETEYNAQTTIQGTELNVVVKGYGVQTEGLSSSVPSEVWTEIGD